jgi:hypothetical protein
VASRVAVGDAVVVGVDVSSRLRSRWTRGSVSLNESRGRWGSGVAMRVWVSVRMKVGVWEGVAVGVRVKVKTSVSVGVALTVEVSVAVGVGEEVSVGV